ncbi:major facilitator superfamily domain-containing protein [Syncephalastrum racemosum]|uniref:Major facilitator superfamily domain-containing protein n=1 Tax=Syncephalastrum racemosum TaxID=13706 RepID=A0A1X2HW96_SYNRA|nr:major facilitator superfamily domain-containing protein [Syncephalastrum racemosum]
MFPQLTAFGYLPALNTIREEFNATINMANATVGVFVALQAITPMLWGPLGDLWGRRPVYLVSLAIYIGACIGAVFSQSILQILFMRMLMALGSGSVQVLGTSHVFCRRGSYTALFSIGQMVAPLTGPIVSGAISNQAGWRYIFVMFALLGATFFIIIFCFIPETLRSLVGNGSGYANPTLMQWIQRRRTLCQLKTESATTPVNGNRSTRSRFTMPDFTQPLRSLGQLDFFVLFTYLGLHFGVFITQMTVASIFLQVDYGLNDLQIGLTFISRDVGAIVGSLVHGRILDRQYAHYLCKYQANLDEEKKMDIKSSRLAPDFPIYRARCGHIWIDALLLQTSSVAFAWCLQYNVHIAALLILQCIFTFGHNGLMVTTQALMTDLATGRVATVAAALNFVRCGLG